jgi:hypothetical protein
MRRRGRPSEAFPGLCRFAASTTAPISSATAADTFDHE